MFYENSCVLYLRTALGENVMDLETRFSDAQKPSEFDDAIVESRQGFSASHFFPSKIHTHDLQKCKKICGDTSQKNFVSIISMWLVTCTVNLAQAHEVRIGISYCTEGKPKWVLKVPDTFQMKNLSC